MTTTHMTGAELQTLREACNLSRDEFGELAGVAPRTVKHWENGRAGVPADVADMVQRLDYRVGQAVALAVDAITSNASTSPPLDLVLLRYRTAEDLARYRADMDGMLPSVHGAIIGQLCRALRFVPGFGSVRVRIVWMNSEQYDAWRTASGMPDTESTRAAWAAQQVDQQAIPHRGDQPPAG